VAERKYRVVWAKAAARDLEEIILFVASNSPLVAERLLDKTRRKARSLGTSPLRGRNVPELLRFGMRRWHELVIRPYRLICRVSGHAVLVLAVFDGGRDLQEVLLERLVRQG
jgi:toxin ParE1/3/4